MLSYTLCKINKYKAIGIQKFNHFNFINLDVVFATLDKELTEEQRNQLYSMLSQSYGNDKLPKEMFVLSVCSGIISGVFDMILGDFSLTEGKEWAGEKFQNVISRTAHLLKEHNNEKVTLDSRSKEIKFLEKMGPLASDGNEMGFGGTTQHHFKDFAHHPNLAGLIFSILTQFSGKCFGLDEHGNFKTEEVKRKEYLGTDVKSKLYNGTILWLIHMLSDVNGSNKTAGAGCGLPGPFVSLITMVGSIRGISDLLSTEDGKNRLTTFALKLYSGKYEKISKFDMRAEAGVVHEVQKQSYSVILNEALLRLFFGLEQLVKLKDQINSAEDFFSTVEKVYDGLTDSFVFKKAGAISLASFTIIDIGDAAVRSAGFNTAVLTKLNYIEILKLGNYCFSLLGCYCIRLTSSPEKIISQVKEFSKNIEELEQAE